MEVLAKKDDGQSKPDPTKPKNDRPTRAVCVKCGSNHFELHNTKIVCGNCGKVYKLKQQNPLPGERTPAALLPEWIASHSK